VVIYAIENIINGKVLIGQTTRSSKVRWKEHCRLAKLNKHENPYFQSAWNLYGFESFRLIDLDVAGDQIELDLLEEVYIQEFSPNVYNVRSGGNGGCKFNETSRHKMSESQKCRAVNTNSELQRKAAKIRWSDPKQHEWRKNKNVEIWSDPQKVMNMKMSPDRAIKLAKRYESGLRSPDGQVHFPIVNLRAFCREHNLDHANTLKVVQGKKSQYKGWTKYDES